MGQATRKLEFDAAHRVMKHESKCRNLHGHRYVVELTVQGRLDDLGRVIDFGDMKRIFGGWIDEALDHGTILNKDDDDLIALCHSKGWKYYLMDSNPTAENMARELFDKAVELLSPRRIWTIGVRVYETPNCWSDYPDVDL